MGVGRKTREWGWGGEGGRDGQLGWGDTGNFSFFVSRKNK